MITHFSEKPIAMLYMPLPNGGADVWLRKNIEQKADDEGGTYYTAEEVYFRTNEPQSEIEENFEEYFAGNLPKPPAPQITVDERLSALEAAIVDLAEEVVGNG